MLRCKKREQSSPCPPIINIHFTTLSCSFFMNNIDSESHIWFYFDLHQGKWLFLNGQVKNTSNLQLNLFYIEPLNTYPFTTYNCQFSNRYTFIIFLWFIFYNIECIVTITWLSFYSIRLFWHLLLYLFYCPSNLR